MAADVTSTIAHPTAHLVRARAPSLHARPLSSPPHPSAMLLRQACSQPRRTSIVVPRRSLAGTKRPWTLRCEGARSRRCRRARWRDGRLGGSREQTSVAGGCHPAVTWRAVCASLPPSAGTDDHRARRPRAPGLPLAGRWSLRAVSLARRANSVARTRVAGWVHEQQCHRRVRPCGGRLGADGSRPRAGSERARCAHV